MKFHIHIHIHNPQILRGSMDICIFIDAYPAYLYPLNIHKARTQIYPFAVWLLLIPWKWTFWNLSQRSHTRNGANLFSVSTKMAFACTSYLFRLSLAGIGAYVTFFSITSARVRNINSLLSSALQYLLHDSSVLSTDSPKGYYRTALTDMLQQGPRSVI